MRLPAVLLLAAVVITALPSVGATKESTGVEFVRVWPAWRQAASFVRIQEYFGHGEDTGSQTMLRTQPNHRTGFYFLTRTRNAGPAHARVKFVLDVIKPDSPQPQSYTFTTSLPVGSHVFNLGLTGTDWAGEKAQPVAWRLRLLDAQGQALAARQSFLWSMPPAGEH